MNGVSLMTLPQRERLIELIPDRGYVLEIGTASGVTASMLAAARPNATLISVDNFCDRYHPDVLRTDPHRVHNCLDNMRSNQRLWVGESRTLLQISPIKFELVIVDADHRYQGVLDDLHNVASRTSQIAAHDYGEPTWPEVSDAVNQFCAATPWKVVETVGSLAILRLPS